MTPPPVSSNGIPNPSFENENHGDVEVGPEILDRAEPTLPNDPTPVSSSRALTSEITVPGPESQIPMTLKNGSLKYLQKELPTEENNNNGIGNLLLKSRSKLDLMAIRHKRKLKLLLLTAVTLMYNIYLIFAINYTVSKGIQMDWCHGLGFLIIITVIVYWSLFYYFALKKYFGRKIKMDVINPLATSTKRLLRDRWNAYTNFLNHTFPYGVALAFYVFRKIQWALSIGAVGGLVIFLVIDTWDQPRRLTSAFGVLALVAIGFLISKHPANVNWAQVGWALGLQFSLGLAVLRWDVGRNVLNCLSFKATTFLNFATSGSDFVYGYLSSGKPNDELTFLPIFAFKPLSVMFFFGFCISLLYYYGAMQWLIQKLGWVLQTTVGTTAAESMNASANIFLSMIECPLLIKPFLARMTDSEIHTIMTSGFATVAGSTLAAYVTFGVSASYVISATVMASFCALGFSKLIYPETRISHTTLTDIGLISTKADGTAIDAAAQGAMQGVTLIGCVIANIIAFVSFVSFLNALIGWLGGLVGADISFELILGKVFIPLAWLMGVDGEECETVALLLGLKTVTNEFIAYQRLVKTILSPRSRAIASFALCSFANVGSVGISLGGLSALVPERRIDFGKVVGRAFVSGTIVGFLNGCVAGILLNEPGYAEWRATFAPINSTTSYSI